MKFKIFLLLFFSLGFFMSNVDMVRAEDGACICEEVSFLFKNKLTGDIGPFVYKNILLPDVGNAYFCEGGVTVTTTGALFDTVKTHNNCAFKEDFCLCVVESEDSDMNGTKLELPPEAISDGVNKTNCGSAVYVDSVGDKPLTYSSCVWYAAAEEAGGALPSGDGTMATSAAPGLPPPPTGAVGTGLGLGTGSGSGSSMSAEDAKTQGEKDRKGVTVVELGNPLGDGRVDIRTILGDIVAAGMGILGSVTLLVFVYGGFLWLTSAGSAEKVKKGSQTMMWAVVGLFLIFGSYAILGLVLEGIGAKQTSSSVPASTLNIP